MGIVEHRTLGIIVDPVGPVSQGIDCNLDAISPGSCIGLYGLTRQLLVGPYDVLLTIAVPTELASVLLGIVDPL